MTETITAPMIETEPTAIDPDTPLHIMCRTCTPDLKPGDRALCGYQILGLPPGPDDNTALCTACEDLYDEHFASHGDKRG